MRRAVLIGQSGASGRDVASHVIKVTGHVREDVIGLITLHHVRDQGVNGKNALTTSAVQVVKHIICIQ